MRSRRRAFASANPLNDSKCFPGRTCWNFPARPHPGGPGHQRCFAARGRTHRRNWTRACAAVDRHRWPDRGTRSGSDPVRDHRPTTTRSLQPGPSRRPADALVRQHVHRTASAGRSGTHRNLDCVKTPRSRHRTLVPVQVLVEIAGLVITVVLLHRASPRPPRKWIGSTGDRLRQPERCRSRQPGVVQRSSSGTVRTQSWWPAHGVFGGRSAFLIARVHFEVPLQKTHLMP